MSKPLMPKATAVWLVENTALTFKQIADFCGLHELEVKGIADGEVAQGIRGIDPIAGGQLTREEIERGQEDSDHVLRLAKPKHEAPEPKRRRGPRYTPVSRRQDRPDAIAWLLRNHPEFSDAQIGKLVGTTKPTINSIRERTHWNISNIKPVDPVTLGLCTQLELDTEVQKAAKRAARLGIKTGAQIAAEDRLKSVEESLAEGEAEAAGDLEAAEPGRHGDESYDPEKVFAGLQRGEQPDDDEQSS